MSINQDHTGEIVLIGGVPVKVIQDQTHALGDTAVGHAVGKGVRLYQKLSSKQPERIQLRCSFISRDRFTYKFLLEELHSLRLPFPFVSRLAALPLVTIGSLVFTQSNSRKSVEDRKSVIDFVITLVEYKVNYFVKLGTKIAWVSWAGATLPDPATSFKCYTTPPEANLQQAITIPSEFIYASIIADKTKADLGTKASSYTELNVTAVNNLNKKFDKLPIAATSVFPTVIKLQYPPSPTHYTRFNTETNLPALNIADVVLENNLYYYPVYNQTQNRQIFIKILPKQMKYGIYLTMIVTDLVGTIFFSQKVVTGVFYKIENMEFIFTKINFDPASVNGSSSLTEFEAGVRLIA